MTMVVAGVLAVKDGKILLVQETQEGHFGKWNLPMGRLEEDESVIDCAIREGREETGFHFRLLHLTGIYQQYLSPNGNGKGNKLGFIFLAEITGGEITHTDEIMKVEWFSLPQIEELNKKGLLRASYLLQVVKDFKDGKKISLDCITVL